MSIVTYENVDTPVFELDTMRYLFRDGLQGMWIDFLPDYAFADTDLTTPANPGEGIAGYVDRGPYGYDGTQPVITARPILGRVPVGGRVNQAIRTEDLSHASWLSFTSADTSVSAPVDGLTPVSFTAVSSDRRVPRYIPIPTIADGQTKYVRGIFKPGAGCTTIALGGLIDSTKFSWCAYNLSTLTATSYTVSNSCVSEFVSAEEISSGAWELVVSITGEASTANKAMAHFGSGSASDLRLNSPIASCEIGFISVTDEWPAPYQRVGNEYDVTEAGVPSVYYAHYDGADDVLPSSLTIPSISEGCFILVGTAGIWIDNEWVNTTGTLTVGPTTYTGGPEGILPVVGNILSIIWRETPLTEKERQKVIQAGVKRGSAGLIELDAEIADSGGVYVKNTDSNLFVPMTGTMVSGQRYYAKMQIVNKNSGTTPGIHFRAVTSPPVANLPSVGGDFLYSVVGLAASGGNSQIQFVGASTRMTVQDVSVRRLIMPGETP